MIDVGREQQRFAAGQNSISSRGLSPPPRGASPEPNLPYNARWISGVTTNEPQQYLMRCIREDRAIKKPV